MAIHGDDFLSEAEIAYLLLLLTSARSELPQELRTRVIKASLKRRLQMLATAFERGQISRGLFFRIFSAELGAAYLRFYSEALGTNTLTYSQVVGVRRLIEHQINYLVGFADDIANGTGIMDYQQRAGLYATSVRAPRELGNAERIFATGRAVRVLGAGDHRSCAPCLRNNGRVFTNMGELIASGWLPVIGCQGAIYCRCRIVPA